MPKEGEWQDRQSAFAPLEPPAWPTASPAIIRICI